MIERGASLRATGLVVNGSVQAEGHKLAQVKRSRVDGSIQLTQGATATLHLNTVGSDIQLFSNRGTQSVVANRVDGNLQCKSNTPAPTGERNVVEGNKEDQCRRL